jgi:hypothetical protein
MAENIELTGRFTGECLDVIATIKLQEHEPQMVCWQFNVPSDVQTRGTSKGEIPRVSPNQPHVQIIQVNLSHLNAQQRELLKLKQIRFDITLTNLGSKADSDTKSIGQLIESAQREQRKKVF